MKGVIKMTNGQVRAGSGRRFESATMDDPILLSPVKPQMRSLYLVPMVDLTAE